MSRALVIDFETANYANNSACAVGLVLVEAGKIIESKSHLIKPPKNWFIFTDVHGITWEDVKNAPSFDQIYLDGLRETIESVDVMVAHNSGFDKRVLEGTAMHYGLRLPKMTWQCTVQMSRNVLGIKPANLPNVCKELKIPLNHHDALSDALACAKIYLKATSA